MLVAMSAAFCSRFIVEETPKKSAARIDYFFQSIRHYVMSDLS